MFIFKFNNFYWVILEFTSFLYDFKLENLIRKFMLESIELFDQKKQVLKIKIFVSYPLGIFLAKSLVNSIS